MSWMQFTTQPRLRYYPHMAKDTLREHLSKIGSKGGKAAGKRKARGGGEYYRKLRAKRSKKP